MRRLICGVLSLGSLCFLLSAAGAQPPDRPGRPPERDGERPPPPPHPIFEALDTDHDGVLSPEEIRAASESLRKLDRNGDGKVTRDELRPHDAPGRGPGRGPDGAGADERGRRADRGGPPAGPGERRPPGPPDRPRGGGDDLAARGPGGGGRDAGSPGPDRPGPRDESARRPRRGGPPSVLPPFVRDELRLTEAQQRQLDELDADVRAKIDRILTDDQKRELERVRQRRGGGPPPGGDGAGSPDGRDGGRRAGPGPAGRPGRPQPPDGEND